MPESIVVPLISGLCLVVTGLVTFIFTGMVSIVKKKVDKEVCFSDMAQVKNDLTRGQENFTKISDTLDKHSDELHSQSNVLTKIGASVEFLAKSNGYDKEDKD